MKTILLGSMQGALFLAAFISCKKPVSPLNSTPESTGYSIEIYDEAVKNILSEKSLINTIASGFEWSEGTLWLPDQDILIFSDVPENKIYSWSPTNGVSVWLDSSGYTGPREIRREGSNGLFLSPDNQLIICQHGDRRVARMDAPLTDPRPRYIPLADAWRGNKLNSPNDAAYYQGELFFTDPPYGLPGQDEDPEKELGFSGVYRVGKKGVVVKLIDDLKRPNGIAFNEKTNMMYVANSDPDRAIWMRYDISGVNNPQPHLLYDATEEVSKYNGLPDGLKVHPSGYVFATGPGGIWIFSPSDELSARIFIPQATANCAFDETFSNLYVAADSTVLQIPLIPVSN